MSLRYQVYTYCHMTLFTLLYNKRMQYPNVKFSVIIRHRIIWNIKII